MQQPRQLQKEGRRAGSETLDGDDEVMQDTSDVLDTSEGSEEPSSKEEEDARPPRNLKRKRNTDDIEDEYMRRIGREEESDKKKTEKEEESSNDDTSSSSSSSSSSELPTHETVISKNTDIEQSNRTVFLGNVSTQAIKSKSAKKVLLRHLASFLPSLPVEPRHHKIESVRFRSTAFAGGNHIPKRASFAHKEVMDETTPSTNAYVVYSSVQAARKAPAALNGTRVLDRHLRVDSVAHPSEINHKRCVFVGNLDFVDQQVAADDNTDEKKKKKKRAPPADVEEGLWRVFNNIQLSSGEEDNKSVSKEEEATIGKRGIVESVRVIRDRATRVGKGFAYVQFYDANNVEEALLADGKSFKPMLPRKLRVVRAKKVVSKKSGTPSSSRAVVLGRDRTLQGRAPKLLGKGGAAKLKRDQPAAVFEGHRATKDGSSIKVKTKSRGSKANGKGKPQNRSSRRAAAYKAKSK